jgi:hypothetical protein
MSTKFVLGSDGRHPDNTKKVEDIGNSIEGCWKYPKLILFFFGLSYRFRGALTHSWQFFDAPTFFLFFFCFWIKSIPFVVDDKGRSEIHWEVCHHAVRDYNFLTQKKKIFLKINSLLPIICSLLWIQQCTYGYVQYTYDNFNIKKNFVFLVMTTDHDNLLGMLDQP